MTDIHQIHAFGIHGPIRDNVVIYKYDRNRHGMIFPVGSLLAAFDPETNKMDFFDRKQNHCNDTITALAISPNNKVVANAVHGSIGDGAQIHVFQTATRHRVTTMTHRSKVNALCFSCDSKWLICASDDLIAIWSWEKEKLDYSGSISGNISRISRPPQQIDMYDLMFTTTGVGHARIWVASSRHRLNNSIIMQTQAKEQKFIFTDHTWLRSSDNEEVLRMVVVMEPRKKSKGPDNTSLSDSSIVIFQLNENVVSTQPSLEIEESIDISLQENVKIFSISQFTSDLSFILGCSKGYLLVYEYEQDRLGGAKFNKTQRMQTMKTTEENVLNIHVNNKGNAVLVTDMMNVYTCWDRDTPTTLMNDNHDYFTQLKLNGHFGGVNAMDCCVERQIFVSCGNDNVLSIYDYQEKQRILSHQFECDEPNTVAIHPGGHKILVGYKDKIVMYHLLIDKLKAYREMSCKVCHDIKFAPLGHYFAAVLSNDIYVYASYSKSASTTSFQMLHCFTGHSGVVKTLSWANDSILFTSGSDKHVYGWDIQRGSRIDNLNVFRSFGECTALDVSSKGLGYEATACTSDGALHWVVWSGIGEIEVSNVYTRSDDVSISLTFNNDRTLLFVGTTKGHIRCFDWESKGKGGVNCIREFCHHSKFTGAMDDMNDNLFPIKCLKSVGRYLFSGGGIDGSIFLCEITQNSKMHLDSKQPQNGFQLTTDAVALISLEDYNQNKEILVDLEQKIVTLNNEHEYALHSKDALWKNEIKEITEKTNEIVEAEHRRYEELRKKYDETIKNHVVDLDTKDNLHSSKLRELEESYEERLTEENSNSERLKKEILCNHKDFNISLEKQKVIYDKKIEGIVREYESIQKKLKAQIAKLEDEAKESDKIFAEILDQQEEEYEMELRNVIAKSDERLYEESIRNVNMKGAVQNLNSKKNQLSRLNEELRSKHLFTEETYRRELSMRKETQLALEIEKDMVSNLESQIKQKDDQIKALQAEKKSLANLNILLETKIEECQQEKRPLNEQLMSLNEKISDLNQSVEKQRKMIEKATFELNQKEMKLQSQTKNVKSSEQLIRQLKSEFMVLSGLLDDDCDRQKQNALKDKLDAAYKKFRLSELN